MPPKGWRKSKSAGDKVAPSSKHAPESTPAPAAPLPTVEKPSPPAELKAKSDIPPPNSFEQYQAASTSLELSVPETKSTSVSKSQAAEAFADLVKSGRHRISVLTGYNGEAPECEPNETWDLREADRGPYVTIFTFLLEKYKWDPTMIGIIFAALTITLEMAVTGFGFIKWKDEQKKAEGKK